ncbi:MAG: beta family protein [Desulfarculaceae bacterium]|nr:beta family protein [Desulfarculaceae bacterium]
MIFGADHYVPVLKVKQNEKKALASIPSTIRARVTPLLEIVERKPDKHPTIKAHLNTAFKDLAASIRLYRRCFLDAREVAPDGSRAAEAIFKIAESEGIVFTPVTGITRKADVAAALKNQKNGLALRLSRQEFESGRLPADLASFLSTHKLEPDKIDLIVDLGAVDDMIAPGIVALSKAFLSAVPDHAAWRTFTISACSFPQSMASIKRHSHGFAERGDWLTWRDALHAMRGSLTRLPTFSDCAIQHPIGVEGFDFRKMPVSASIRYTLQEQWLLIKGESTRAKLPSKQFPRLAHKLVYGPLRSYYAGPDHCKGCADIQRAADGKPGYGSAGVWRRIGTVHHITVVTQQIASLPWP